VTNTELARRAGWNEFSVSRLRAFVRAVERRDPSVMKLAEALGLPGALAFEDADSTLAALQSVAGGAR
jgi:hypothetical protein